MKRLYVLYDAECELCRRCGYWLSLQSKFIELVFVPLQSPDLEERFPGISEFKPQEQMLVVSDDGAVYRGPSAWIMCLYALRYYRHWAQRMAHPALFPWARRVCELVAQNRFWLSRAFLKATPAEVVKRLTAESPPLQQCSNGC